MRSLRDQIQVAEQVAPSADLMAVGKIWALRAICGVSRSLPFIGMRFGSPSSSCFTRAFKDAGSLIEAGDETPVVVQGAKSLVVFQWRNRWSMGFQEERRHLRLVLGAGAAKAPAAGAGRAAPIDGSRAERSLPGRPTCPRRKRLSPSTSNREGFGQAQRPTGINPLQRSAQPIPWPLRPSWPSAVTKLQLG